MSYRVVVRGDNPSGKILAVLCARTGGTMEHVRSRVSSPSGFVLRTGLGIETANSLKDDIPEDGSAIASVEPDHHSSVVVLVGYRPGSRGRLRSAIQRMSRLSTEEVIQYLSSIPIALRSNTDMDTARAIKEILEREGGIVEIRSSGDIPGYSMLRRPSARLDRPSGAEPALMKPPAEQAYALVPTAAPEPPQPPPVQKPAEVAHSRVFPRPPELQFFSPEPSVEVLPPVVEQPDSCAVFSEPHMVRFTIPASGIPPVIPGVRFDRIPERKPSQEIYPLYIHPVNSVLTEKTLSVICGKAGISRRAAAEKVAMAPCLLCCYGERINALVKLRELSEAGVPVSLYPGSAPGSSKPGGLFPGWLHGK